MREKVETSIFYDKGAVVKKISVLFYQVSQKSSLYYFKLFLYFIFLEVIPKRKKSKLKSVYQHQPM